jgi:general secretion pathway protein H
MELMIVLIIVGMFVSFGARKFVNRSTEMRSSVRQFSAIVNKLRNRARIENRTYRLVFDLPSDRKKAQSYWIEGTDKPALLLNSEQRQELADAMEAENRDQERGKDEPPPDPQGFVPDNSVLKEAPAYLPEGLFFESIELGGDPVDKVEEGRVYIYFFPHGYVQASAIHLTNRDTLNWTLVVRGLTGRVDIIPKYRSLSDFIED